MIFLFLSFCSDCIFSFLNRQKEFFYYLQQHKRKTFGKFSKLAKEKRRKLLIFYMKSFCVTLLVNLVTVCIVLFVFELLSQV